jgi:hypothetical protein
MPGDDFALFFRLYVEIIRRFLSRSCFGNRSSTLHSQTLASLGPPSIYYSTSALVLMRTRNP